MQPTPRIPMVRLQTTDEQQRQANAGAASDGVAPQPTAQELEERIAPKLAANHNELMVQELEERIAPKLAANHNELMVQELEERVTPRRVL